MSEEKYEKILQLIKQNEYRSHFFMELSEAKNPIPWLEILKKEGYLLPEKNSEPIEDKDNKGFYSIPRWEVLGFLENVSKYNNKYPDEKVMKLLLDIIEDYTKYQGDPDKRIDNYITDWYILKILSDLPVNRISLQHIEYIKLALNSRWDSTLIQSHIGKVFLPLLLDNNAKELVIKLIDILLDFYDKREDGSNEYWFNDILEKNKASLIKKYGEEISKKIIEKIREITTKDKARFNIAWIPTIEDHPQVSFPMRYDCQLIRFLRDSLKEFQSAKLNKIVKSLLSEEYAILKRVGIYIINVYYDNLKELFWGLEENPLEKYELTHEIYELLKNNSNKFQEGEIEVIINWIETKKYHLSEDVKEDKKEEIVAYRKKEWYSALLISSNTKIKDKYLEYDKINPAIAEHPGFLTWSEISTGHKITDDFPVILTKENKVIVDYLNSFEGSRDPTQPSKEGLAEELSKAVLNNPTKFTQDIDPFLSVEEIYLHGIFKGFRDALKKEKDIDWQTVLIFIEKIISKQDFWTKIYEERGFNYRDWIISEVASIIEDGAQSNKYSFGDSLNNLVKEILFKLDEKSTSQIFESDDIVTSVLNSVRGSIYSALIILSLKVSRTKKEVAKKWDEEIQKLFSEHLNNPSKELLVVIGQYLPHIYNLDKDWLRDNLDKILNKDKEELWNCAMASYLFYSSMLYKDLYRLLVGHGDYEKAIKTNLKNQSSNNIVVQHLCVAYLNDIENLSDGLFFKLLNNKDPSQINEIIRFFWSLRREELDESKKDKIKPLWNKVFEVCYQEKNNEPQFEKLLSKLPEWLTLVEEIDNDIFTLVKGSVKYIKKAYDTWFLIEYLSKHVTKTPRYVGEIILELLNNQIYPDYKQENIIEIVSALYTNSENDLANKICNIYLSKGFYFLKPIFDRNQPEVRNE